MKVSPLDEFVFGFVEAKHVPMVLAHLKKNYYQDEPINKALGCTDDRARDLDARVTNILKRYPKSLCAFSRQDPDKLAGVLIINVHNVDNPLPPFEQKSPITGVYFYCLEQMEESYSIAKTYNVSIFPELAILSVDKEFRGKGLATELYRRGITQLTGDGHSLIYSEFSNPLSRKVGERVGFKEESRFYFKDFKHKDDSDVFDKTQLGPESYCGLAVLHVKPEEN